MHHEVSAMAVKNSCFGPFSIVDFRCDEFLGCALHRDRNCFRQDLGSEQMVHSDWVLWGEFKYIFTNVLVGVQKPQGIITTMGVFSTSVPKWEKGGTVTGNQSGEGYNSQLKKTLSPHPSFRDGTRGTNSLTTFWLSNVLLLLSTDQTQPEGKETCWYSSCRSTL